MKRKHKIIANLMGATVVACLLLAPKAHAADGGGLLAAALTAHTADMFQTLQISRDCREQHTDREPFLESNPLLGRCPSRGRVLTYFAATAVGLTLAHKHWGHASTYGWLALEVAIVGRNYHMGLRGQF